MRHHNAKNWHAIGWLLLLVMAALYSVTARAQTAPTLTFTPQTVTGNGSVVPSFTWSTSPAASSCNATTVPADPQWSGAKPASGAKTLPAITSSKTYQLDCTWAGDTTATVSWTPALTHTDQSAMARCSSQTDTGPCLRSFLVVRGSDATSVGSDSKVVDDRNATSYAWTGLPVGTHWFSVVQVDGNGVASDQTTPPVSKTITSGQTVTRSIAITVNPKPSAATGLSVQ